MTIKWDQLRDLPNGARFHTADLHVHSYPASADVRDPEMTPEAIIDTAFDEGITVLAITDHNTSRGAERVATYAQKHPAEMLVLPGVEVSTAHGHLLVYFPPAEAHLVQDLLSRIGIVGDAGGRDSHTRKSMAEVIAEAHSLGGIAIAAHIDRAAGGFELQHAGYPNWKKDIIVSTGLYGLEFDEAANLNWYSDCDVGPSGDERRKLLHGRKEVAGTAARLRLAAVQNSDAHTMADFRGQARKRNLTRFKMDSLTFESFRTALIDSEARVRPVSMLPPSVPRILGIAIQGGFLDHQMVRFSDNLNVFLGGRGTGKSTALRSLAYALGVDEEIASHDNCPDDVVVYTKDANGVLYRHRRERGGGPEVLAWEGKNLVAAASDVFPIEYYRQGELADVAKDPLGNPQLLQDFLDRHLVLHDLQARIEDLLAELEQNAAQLKPLEASAISLPQKEAGLKALNDRLKVAESGVLHESAALQSQVAAEKDLLRALDSVIGKFNAGMSMAQWQYRFPDLARAVGPLTEDPQCKGHFDQIEDRLKTVNDYLGTTEAGVNKELKSHAGALSRVRAAIAERHVAIEQELGAKTEELRKQGYASSLAELKSQLAQRTTLSREVGAITGKQRLLDELRRGRETLLAQLDTARGELTARRKAQVTRINEHLRAIIQDHLVVLWYDEAGMVERFLETFLEIMHGSYFGEEEARRLCRATTPRALVALARRGDIQGIAKIGNLSPESAAKIVQHLSIVESGFALEIAAKPFCPTLKVLTRGDKQRQIPVSQLSDGQKHTILLTIALLSDSKSPLVIDQPEDDLDNAFISTAVVGTLRRIKEHRQVILVTHNPNIAVLGDAELLLPLRREGLTGGTWQIGSIDRRETAFVVEEILEGGALAFERRRQVYGH